MDGADCSLIGIILGVGTTKKIPQYQYYPIPVNIAQYPISQYQYRSNPKVHLKCVVVQYCSLQICCIEPLCVSRTTVDNSSSHPAVGSLFFAMASMSKLLIVALRPSLQVHYTRPLTGSSDTLPLFGWQFVSIRTSETERSTDPVLLFARDQYACFLQVVCCLLYTSPSPRD